MKKYIEIPNIVEGYVYDGKNSQEIINWSKGDVRFSDGLMYVVGSVANGIEGDVGDYVIKDNNNFFIYGEKDFIKLYKQL